MQSMNRRDFLKTASVTVAGLAMSAKPFPKAGSNAKKPNIIVIMADDISAKEFPTYKIPSPVYADAPCSTPVLEMIKNKGVQFRHGWASPLCHPSRGMIMTGRYAHRTGWWSNGYSPKKGEKNYPLNESHLTIGKIAKKAGYATQLVGKWQLDGDKNDYHFDEFVFTPGKYAARAPADKKPMGPKGLGKPSFYWNPGYTLYNHPDYPESKVGNGKSYRTTWNDHASDIELKFIKNFVKRSHDNDKPFFVYWPAHLGHLNWDYVNDGMGYPGVPPMDTNMYPGTKIVKEKMPDGSIVKRTPAGMNYHVQYLDYTIGELIAQLRNLGIEDETLIIFTTDNGTAGYGKGLSGAVKEYGSKVPFCVYGPGLIKPRGEVDDFAGVADIAPTIADLTGADLPRGYEFDGLSMMPFLSGKTSNFRNWIYSYVAECQMVRTKNVLRDGMGVYWDTRGTVDQEKYKEISQDKPPAALAGEINTIKNVLEKYPSMPMQGPAFERYAEDKKSQRKYWLALKKRIREEQEQKK